MHMGDHAYDMGFSGDRRGDAYMNAFQRVIANCPWFPIIGNHEANDGDHYNRYMNIAWGEVMPEAGAVDPSGRTTSTRPLARRRRAPRRPAHEGHDVRIGPRPARAVEHVALHVD